MVRHIASTSFVALAIAISSLSPAAQAQEVDPHPSTVFDPVNVVGTPREPPQGHLTMPAPAPRVPGTPVTDLGTALQLTTRLPSFMAEQARERASIARVDQARSAFGPSLDAGASYGYAHDRFDIDGVEGFNQFTRKGRSASARATLSQTIFSSGQLTAGLRSAEANRELRRQARRHAENEALLASVTAYVGLQRDLALLSIAKENLQLLSEQASSSSERYQKRELTVVDYDQVRARLEASRADLATAQASADISKARFLQVVGEPAGNLAPAPPPLALMPTSLEDAQAIALGESPLVIAAHARERATRAALRGAQGALGPVVSIEGSLSRGGQTVYDNNLNQTLARGSVVVRMPIYDSGRRFARIEEAKAENDADSRLIDQAQRDAQFNVQATWDRYTSGLNSITSLREAANAANAAYNGAVLQERAGLVTTLDILVLLRDLLIVRSQLVNAEADSEISRYALLGAMGRLEFDRLNIVAVGPNDTPPLKRISQAYSLPLGPLVQVIDSVAAGHGRNAPASRDPATSVRLPGLPAPDPSMPAVQDTTISESDS